MPVMTTRRINGVDYERDAFVDHLVETIDTISEENGGRGARMPDIIAHWDDEDWNTPRTRQWLANELGKLAARKKAVLVKSEERGYFKVATAYRIQGNSGNRIYETDALRLMKENGGFITYTDLRNAMNIGARFGSRKTYDKNDPPKPRGRKRLTAEALAERKDERHWPDEHMDLALREALNRSDLIHHDFPEKNLWNLDVAILHTLPLEARWARLLIDYGTENLARPARLDSQQEGRQVRINFNRFLTQVGDGYYDARKTRRLEFEDLLDDPDLRAEITAIAGEHPDRQGFLDFLQDDDRPSQWIKGETRPEAFFDYEAPEDWPAVVLALFEAGHPQTHDLIRTSWHEAFAAFYRVDAAALSRGLLMPALGRV